jgi:FKBP12-rapamycin complex-associated protein
MITSRHVMQMLSHKTLVMLLGMDPSQNPDQPLPAHHPQVTFAYTKHLWMSDRREEAYRYVLILLSMFCMEKIVAMVSHAAIFYL